MLAEPEHYKGILFIRISALPGEQKTLIRKNYNREAIIKILKEDALLNDCILYSDYLDWYKQFNASRTLKSGKSATPAKLSLSETSR
jgi:hypothetical protein